MLCALMCFGTLNLAYLPSVQVAGGKKIQKFLMIFVEISLSLAQSLGKQPFPLPPCARVCAMCAQEHGTVFKYGLVGWESHISQRRTISRPTHLPTYSADLTSSKETLTGTHENLIGCLGGMRKSAAPGP